MQPADPQNDGKKSPPAKEQGTSRRAKVIPFPVKREDKKPTSSRKH